MQTNELKIYDVLLEQYLSHVRQSSQRSELSVVELAKETGLSETTVRRICENMNEISISRANRKGRWVAVYSISKYELGALYAELAKR